MNSFVTQADRNLARRLFTPDPALTLLLGEKPVRWQPDFAGGTAETEIADGLYLRMERVQYADFPVAEWLAFVENRGAQTSEIVSGAGLEITLPCSPSAVLHHGNGDTCRPDGYAWRCERADHPIVLQPVDGTSCNGAFPYMRLQDGDWGVSLAVGWPAMWRAEWTPAADGLHLRVGQKRCHTVLHPGEALRLPRVTLAAHTGDTLRAANLWRRWYLAHILPRENGQPLPPKCCMHVFGANGMPEFTGADEQNQLQGIGDYLRRGIHPDVWWVDAGWYPCGGEWHDLGDWRPDPRRFPNGLTPLGERCNEEGMQLLLWFEPERALAHSPLAQEHPEWMLRWKQDDGTLHPNCLVNLGDPACCRWVIDRVDGIIRQSHVRIYRQDFNFNPAPYWEQAEADDRIGMAENLHVQGYLHFWDTLRERNPGLLIDSCASGGRRNDLETMRRAVPLHYTDVGYGNHPIKQRQHHQMFSWIPYFRAHNMNWYNPESGEYDGHSRPADRFSYYAAMAPALTDMLEHDADEEAFALARRMQPIWRKAARLMLNCDYYPLTPAPDSDADWYAVQFHSPEEDAGFVEAERNSRAPEASFLCRLHGVEPQHRYLLADAESGEAFEMSGQALLDGFSIVLAPRSARILFYHRKDGIL